MSTFWRITFIVLHVVEIVLIWALFKNYNFVDPSLYETVKSKGSVDVLNVAVQLGRLDLVSMFLGAISILIALAAVFAFIEVRSRAEIAAIAAARIAVNERVGVLFENEMKRRNQSNVPVINLTKAEEADVLTAAAEIRSGDD